MEAMGELTAGGALWWSKLPAAADAGEPPAAQPRPARVPIPRSVPVLRSVPAARRHPAGIKHDGGASGNLARSLELLKGVGSTAVAEAALYGFREAADFAADIEEISRTVEFLQLVAAGAVDRSRRQATSAARLDSGGSGAQVGWVTGWGAGTAPHGRIGLLTGPGEESAMNPEAPESPAPDPADDGYRNTGEFLRARLRISAAEARRRLALAAAVLPQTGITGHQQPAERPELGAALAAGTIASRPATIITAALDRVRHHAPEDTTARMEHALTRTAAENDTDFLTRIARRWSDAIDQDGPEPTENELRHRQGAFLRPARRGLHHVEIFATPDQYEHLLTVMNTATNPRAHSRTAAGNDGTDNGKDNDGDSAEELDRRTRPQRLLDGLIGACKTALSTGALPLSGGLRPQVMVTIDYRDLLDRLEGSGTTTSHNGDTPGTGSFTFTGPVTASTVRKIACDADIIPVLLGSQGRILDIGRTTRIFPAHIRKAITARDQGCAFPNCTIPAPWCEAHHISYWSRGGTTSTDNGTLLSHHHHLIHKEQWQIQVKAGIPWFIAPPHVDPRQEPRRNHYQS